MKRLFAKLGLLKAKPQQDPLSTKERGSLAEAFAEKTLKREGYKVLARNLSDRNGELDLVLAPKDDPALIVVVEIRSAKNLSSKDHEEVLPHSKRKQVLNTARRLIPKQRFWKPGKCSIRFDAVLVDLDSEGAPLSAEHYADAFQPSRSDWF